MIPWVTLDISRIPGGTEELRLMRRGAEFSIMLGRNELMNSRLSGSEEALATLPCGRIRQHRSAHILIGGLGMGFTLRAALGAAPTSLISKPMMVRPSITATNATTISATSAPAWTRLPSIKAGTVATGSNGAVVGKFSPCGSRHGPRTR